MSNLDTMIERTAEWWANNLTTIHSARDDPLDERLHELAEMYMHDHDENITGKELWSKFRDALIDEMKKEPFQEDSQGSRLTLYTEYYPCDVLCRSLDQAC